MRLRIPMKYLIFFPALIGVVGTAMLCRGLLLKGWDSDRTKLGLDSTQAVGEAAYFEVETWIKTRLRELELLSQSYEASQPERIFLEASSDFNSEVLNITFFRPQGEEGYSIEFATNSKLMEKHHLPKNSPFLMNKTLSIPVREIAQARNTVLLNRSFVTSENRAIGVQSLVLFGKVIDGNPRPAVIVADFLSSSLGDKLGHSKLHETFLVNGEGHLVAHTNPALLAKYSASAFAHFPLSRLPASWRNGSNFTWGEGAAETLASVQPTGLPEVFLVSQVSKGSFGGAFANAEKYFFLATWANLGVCLLLSLWVNRRLRRSQATDGGLK